MAAHYAGDDSAALLTPARLRGESSLIVDHSADLRKIHGPGINLCIWRRRVPESLAQYLDAEVAPRDLKRTIRSDMHCPNLEALLDGLPPGEGLRLFHEDLLAQVRLFAELTGAAHLSLKIESFSENLCEAFHVDWVSLRLICSLVGPGTQWLENKDVRRSRLGPLAGGLPDELSGLLMPDAQFGQMERFSVGLMKGERWPGNEGNGLVHRSPRISGSGTRRVLFKIDGHIRTEASLGS